MDEVRVGLEAARQRAQELLDAAGAVSRVRVPEAAQAVADAMPGSVSSRRAAALADAWAAELRALAADATRVAEGVEDSMRELAAADGRAAEALRRLTGYE